MSGLRGTYRYGYKAERQQGDYLSALTTIQTAYIFNESKVFRLASGEDERQYKAKWRHGQGASPPGLGPTGGWVKIPFAELTTISEAQLSAALISSNSQIAEIKSTPCPNTPLFVPIAAEARTFQAKFRENALKIWPPCCALSGATVALEAAHIKPVATSRLATDEILDCYNSILLNVALHRLFDQGLFSFSPDGQVLVSPMLGKKDQEVYGLNREISVLFHPMARKYLDFHRLEVHKSGA